jgi:hypothetical protein
MNGFEKGPIRSSLGAAVFLTVTFSANAHAAGVTVAIQYVDVEQREFADRLVSELASEGYVVESRAVNEPTPCDPNGAKLVSVGASAKAWIRLSEDPQGGETVVATICYLGALPFLQQASSSAPKSDPRKLALAAAEALNGLRSKVPLPALESEPKAARTEPPDKQAAQEPIVRSVPVTLRNSVMLGGALMHNAPEFPIVPAVTTGANLGVTRSASLLFDALWPVGSAELESPEVSARVRTAWLRIGPRLRWAADDFDVSGALLAGPALSWATAVARSPRAGAADVTAGAVLSVKALAEYPRRTAIFAFVSASASALMPGVRVNLGDDAFMPLGAWPIEASIGLGARWGGPF